MKKRGRILRDPRFGPGLLMVEGRQYPFAPEAVWNSEVAPRPGLLVEIETDVDGKIRGITPVPESDLAREQAGHGIGPACWKVGTSAVHALWSSSVMAVAALALTWYLLAAVSLQTPLLGKVDLTFWELLNFVNTGDLTDVPSQRGNPGAGIYGALAVAALLGPIVPQLWKDKRAALGSLLPPLFMLLVGIAARGYITSVGAGPAPAFSSAQGIRQPTATPVSLGLGGYVSAAICMFLAFVSARSLASRSPRGQKAAPPPQKRAA